MCNSVSPEQFRERISMYQRYYILHQEGKVWFFEEGPVNGCADYGLAGRTLGEILEPYSSASLYCTFQDGEGEEDVLSVCIRDIGITGSGSLVLWMLNRLVVFLRCTAVRVDRVYGHILPGRTDNVGPGLLSRFGFSVELDLGLDDDPDQGIDREPGYRFSAAFSDLHRKGLVDIHEIPVKEVAWEWFKEARGRLQQPDQEEKVQLSAIRKAPARLDSIDSILPAGGLEGK